MDWVKVNREELGWDLLSREETKYVVWAILPRDENGRETLADEELDLETLAMEKRDLIPLAKEANDSDIVGEE